MAKGKQTNRKPLTDEEKKQVKKANFHRVLPQRMDKALKAIGHVGDCASPNYLYTTDEAAYLVSQLREAVQLVEGRFSGVPGKSAIFKFPE